ncbi:MAG: PAS domain S-box protein [Planctomycetaceae bacterium]
MADELSPDIPRLLAFVCAADSRIESVATMEGIGPLLAKGQRLLDCVVDLGCRPLLERWSEMVESGFALQADVLVPLKAGYEPVRMLLHAMPLHQGHDEGMYLVAVCSGFRAVMSGPDEVARCRAVLNTAVDSIITINVEGIIASVNPATERMFGYTEDELLGRNISMLMPEPFSTQHDSYIKRYLETGNATIIGIGRQITAMKKGGAEFPVHLAISEFNVRKTRFFTGIVRDLTDLEQVQRQLLQSERLAAIGQMVTGLAHESRNALQRAQACLDMLALDLQERPEQLDLARRTRTALQDLHRLYEEVRGYAAPIHLEYRECELNSIWQKEWDNLATSRKDKRVQLVELGSKEALRCETDVHRMEQVFRNIFENAIHACGDTGTVTVRCMTDTMNGQPAIRVLVSDDGPGMKPDVLRKIFEPFFTTKQKGTGLGMAIVHRIMTALGGNITAGAGPSGGAEISLLFPCRPQNRNAFR